MNHEIQMNHMNRIECFLLKSIEYFNLNENRLNKMYIFILITNRIVVFFRIRYKLEELEMILFQMKSIIDYDDKNICMKETSYEKKMIVSTKS